MEGLSFAAEARVSYDFTVEEEENPHSILPTATTRAAANSEPYKKHKTLLELQIINKYKREAIYSDGNTVLQEEREFGNRLVGLQIRYDRPLTYTEAWLCVYHELCAKVANLPQDVHEMVSNVIGEVWEEGDASRSRMDDTKTLKIEAQLEMVIQESATRGDPNDFFADRRSLSSVEAGTESAEIRGPDSDGLCVICFDDYSVGTNVNSMPCSHIFHGECIARWLEQSHFCPVCRYQIPKNSI